MNGWCPVRTMVLTSVVVVLQFGNSTDGQESTSQEKEFFEAKIRPIFVEHCYECHSVNAEDLEGGLLLDSKWGWQQGGDSGPAVVPGKPEQSLLIEAVRYQEDVVSAMPPKSKLSEQQIDLLEQWVKMGAPDPRPKAEATDQTMVESFDLQKRFQEHWSWRPVVAAEVPEVQDRSWPRSDLDRFILARIEAAGLKPAFETDRRTWLRRVYFDLIGLPPTIDQIRQFVDDPSPQAYETVVQQLLESTHFGEKWARHWMDLVRYAETYGHEFDYPLDHAHQYRDYLIRAFNADVPFDQFVREHIAGDLLSKPRQHPDEGFNESIIGTGFWYFHEATHAPTDVLGNEADIIDNQIDVFGKAFMGLTVACARCHDHKFDAISTADYYALSAYIQSSCRQNYPLDPGQRIANATRVIRDRRSKAITALKAAQFDNERFRPGRYYAAAVELLKRGDAHSTKPSSGLGAKPSDQAIAETARSKGLESDRLSKWIDVLVTADVDAKPIDIGGMLALAASESQQMKQVLQQSEATERTWQQFRDNSIRFADFESDDLPAGWSTSGHAFGVTGNDFGFVIDSDHRPRSGTIDSSLWGKKQAGILRSPTFEITNKNIHLRINSSANVTLKVVIDNYQMAPFNGLLFKGTFINSGASDTKGLWQWKTLAGDLKKYIGHKAYLEFVDEGDAWIAIDEIYLSDQAPPRDSIDPLVQQLHGGGESLDRMWAKSIEDLKAGRDNLFMAWLIDQDLISISEISLDAAALINEADKLAGQLPQPRYAVAMADGTTENANVYIRGSHTSIGEEVPPRFLEALGGQVGSRLDLANRVASADNPLTSRVVVNRLWHHLFGRGIVPTVDDFGPQGQSASHPELLDWLAHDFVQQGWSLKHTIGKIVLSQTYRQSSVANPQLDPLKVATVDPTNSLLHRMRVRRLPAESIRDAILAISGRLDPKPFGESVATHRTPFMTGRGARGSGPLDGNGRRSIYLSIYRNFLNPFMLTFDMPSPFGPQGRRSTSNVPAQALTLMNDPLVIQQAEVWADNVLAIGDLSQQQRIVRMAQQAHGQIPSEDQVAIYDRFLRLQGEQYGGLDKRAWTDLAHALWNMKAFSYLK